MILWWPAAILVAAWVVYLFDAPRAFGKRADGTLPWYAWAVWWPVFVFQWVGHELARGVTSEPVANEVAPGVWVGRRPREDELPPGIAIVVDLCAEMPAARGVHVGREYLNVPTLDARTPSPSTSSSRSSIASRPPAAPLSSTARSVTAAPRPSPPPCSCGAARTRSRMSRRR